MKDSAEGPGVTITPCLWFDGQAEEAARFYVSLFEESRVTEISRFGREGVEVHGRPEGSVMTAAFELAGQPFTALNGGPHFRFTPAISLFVLCDAAAEVDRLWGALSVGGEALMALDRYDWSERYGWLTDRYGLSWQIMLGDGAAAGRRISPCLLFSGDVAGRAEEAIRLYASIFPGSEVAAIHRYGSAEPATEGWVMHSTFLLSGQSFMAMDSGIPHAFAFNEALSLQLPCADQAEIDHYWDRLAEGGEIRQCGWVKDRFGVAWQVFPAALPSMISDPDPEKAGRAMRAMLGMRKLDMAALEAAHRGE